MGAFDEELQRRAAAARDVQAQQAADERARKIKIEDVTKRRWAEINEVCRAGARQLKAAGIRPREIGEVHKVPKYGLVGREIDDYRPIGSAWNIGNISIRQTNGTWLTTDGRLRETGHANFSGLRKYSLDGVIVTRPIERIEFKSPDIPEWKYSPDPDDWELCIRKSHSDDFDRILRDALLDAIANTLNEHSKLH